jgi:hypothetical protein
MSHDLSHLSDDPRVLALLDASIGKVLDRLGQKTEDHPSDRMRHIADWLTGAVVRDDPWLRNIDSSGRPKKLAKCATIESLVLEADRAMAAQQHHLRSAGALSAPLQEGEVVFARLADGMVLVSMTTAAALDRESAMMGHCIGNGAYDGLVGFRNFLSLRDAAGRAHATINVYGDKIMELKGKQNRRPERRYLEILAPWIREAGLKVRDSSSSSGLVQDSRDLSVYTTSAMPDGLMVDGNLDLNHFDGELPKDLKVNGDLYLLSARMAQLPDGLDVAGSVMLAYSGIQYLPENFKVSGNLNLRNTKILKLPEGLQVGGHLNLYMTPITGLPRRLVVGGNLLLDESGILSLPDDLSVAGLIGLTTTDLKRLPDGLVLQGGIDISGSAIVELPEGMVYPGDLILSETDVKRIPKGTRVGGSLDLNGSQVIELPEGLEIGGDLDLRRTKIIHLPDGMRIGGNLDLSGTSVVRLPAGLTVGGYVALNDTAVDTLPYDMVVGEDAFLTGTPLADAFIRRTDERGFLIDPSPGDRFGGP